MLDPTARGAARDLAEATAGDGFDAVIEASGSRAAVSTALDAAGVGGVVVLVGSVFPTDPVGLDPEAVVRGLLTIRGVHNYTACHLADATDFLVRNLDAYPFAGLVGATFPLDRLDEAIETAHLDGHVRVAVAPRP